MNKLEKKLVKCQDKAEDCLSRKSAQKILRKHAKAIAKLKAKRNATGVTSTNQLRT